MKHHKIFTFFIIVLLVCFSACKREVVEERGEVTREEQEKMVEVNKILVEKDAAKIAAFVKRHNWDMTETPTGLWYMIYENGKGKKAETGMVATIKYKILLLDGTLCYSSDKTGPKQFKIGQGGVESGLEEGILLMHEGDKARFIMPPHLAHGLLGDSDKIPARAIILYEVELINLER